MSVSEDLDAINTYMTTTIPVTDSAKQLRNDWVAWWDANNTFYARNVSPGEASLYDVARNKRNAFNLANAKTAKEKAQVQEQQRTGMSTEQAQGLADRRTAEGNYAVPKPPLIPTQYKIAAAAGGGIVLALVGLKKLHII
jgi:hypothetical protein